MAITGRIIKGAYFDSVSLMKVGKQLAGRPGVGDASLVMGTAANKAILATSDLLLPEFEKTGDTDLLLAVRADNEAAAQAALKAADELLAASMRRDESSAAEEPRSLDGALRVVPDLNLALISVAGRYAAAEAEKALEHGLHVMLFSDNVPLESEIRLKQRAVKKGLLVMGPDCGTAIVNGVPLAFANVIRRGPVGIVAAAGTGLQEVSCIITNEGCGVSQALGTGGRDVKKEVGGIMFLQALRALADDADTQIILLVSKPPHPEVVARLNTALQDVHKPVVSLFLGAATSADSPQTLEEAALTAVALARGEKAGGVRAKLARRDQELLATAGAAAKRLPPERVFVRGLFSGGTFCTEAQLILKTRVQPLYSNVPIGGAEKLKDSLHSQAHTLIDLGEDEFTVGRPHPMIDYSLRNKRILEEARTPDVAVILLDVVLGYGSHPDPAGELAGVVREAVRHTVVVCSVTGTEQDPQNRRRVEEALREAGALVQPTNAAACKLAADIAGQKERAS